MNQTVGTCSLCGGAVQVESPWWGTVPPTPTCAKCGAVAKQNHGPVIPMEPPPRWHKTNEEWRPYKGAGDQPPFTGPNC